MGNKMLFNKYLEGLWGSKIKIKILRTLFKFPQKGFGIRELADLLNIDHRSVSQAITDFERNNLVKVKIFGRSHVVYLNEESFVYKKFIHFFWEEENTLNGLLKLIKKYLKKQDLTVCALFGSVAEGKEKYNSDVDLLIITQEKEKINQKIPRLQEQVLRIFGNPLVPLILTRTEFQNINPQLKANIINHNQLIYGKW